MKGNDVRACFGEHRNQRIDRLDHQMNVNRNLHVRADRLAHQRADGQVGHIMIVHHIKMHPVRTGGLDGTHFLAQSGEIRR